MNPELMNDDQWRGYVTAMLAQALAELKELKSIVCSFQDKLFTMKLKLSAISATVSFLMTLAVLFLTGKLSK